MNCSSFILLSYYIGIIVIFCIMKKGHQCLNCQKVDSLGIMQCMIRIVIISIMVITARASMITITVIKHYYNDHDLIITTIMIIIMIMMITTTRLRLGFFALGKTLMICLLRSDRLTNIYYNFETNIYITTFRQKCITTFRHHYYHNIYIIYHYYISSSLQCSTQLTPTAMASLDWRNSDTTVSTGNFSDRIINIILYY